MMDETTLILYSTEGCHLCEDAEALLAAAQAQHASLRWSVVDIANDDTLFERYGWLIPVLRAETSAEAENSGGELRWPFDGPALDRFLCDSGVLP
ncbi:glutaredoxin family protein [Congregibacter litoralis]|nr:glutaredoxin family protein [Congregibacter litoralis]